MSWKRRKWRYARVCTSTSQPTPTKHTQEGSDMDALSSPPQETAEQERAKHPKLKIKLKLTQNNNAFSAANTTSPTPDASRAASKGASRGMLLPSLPRGSPDEVITPGSDIESEDSDEESSRSASVATPGRALTARQAVLRNVVDSTHVSLSMQNIPCRHARALISFCSRTAQSAEEATSHGNRDCAEEGRDSEKT